MLRTWIAITAVAGLAIVSAGCEKLKARDNLNRGVRAYENAKFTEAVEYFKEAVQLDPDFHVARLYLATAYMSQYIPGADSPENLRMAQAAYEEFTKVLEQNPKDEVATAHIASLFFTQKKLDEADEWNRKLIALNPQNKEAFYTLGVIAWTKTFQPRMEARAKMGMQPEDPGPLKDKKVREELRVKSLPIIEEGIGHLQKAMSIDPDYDDAMAYLNLLHRERADLQESAEEYKKDTATADDWVQRALSTKKIKAERKPVSAEAK
ncbi:MAG: tetratricopeptide repeat protein [Bryobacteraceae bacterium]